MSDPFVGEIRLFAGTFAIQNWAFCNGALLNIEQNTALFAVLGTTYGGDGRTTFAIPNLQGRAPLGVGQGTGLNNYRYGQHGGSETTSLTAANMPNHSHSAFAVNIPPFIGGSSNSPENNSLGLPSSASYADGESTNLVEMAGTSLTSTGSESGSTVDNMQPFLALNFIIALVGTFPNRG